MTLAYRCVLVGLVLLLAACGGQAGAPEVSSTPTVASASVTPHPPTVTPAPDPATATAIAEPTAPTAAPTESAPPAPTATIEESAAPSGAEERPEEAILILEPGPGSRVTSPLRVAGIANPTFEQNLVIRLVRPDGTELALQPTTIQADIGQRGPFEAEVPFTVTGEENVLVQIFSDSARDGGLTHLSSVMVRLAESGPEQIEPVSGRAEQIAIFAPQPNATIRGGVVRVEGFALASFEQTLVIDLLDADGNTLARAPVTVNAPDLGQPGSFQAEIPYRLTSAGPGRIVVRDPGAINATIHLSSVEVRLEP